MLSRLLDAYRTAREERFASTTRRAQAAMAKAEVLAAFEKPLDESLSLERQMLLWQTEDHDEGIAAFMEKRKPKYQGR